MLETLHQEIETLPPAAQERLLESIHHLKQEPSSPDSSPFESLRQQAIENGYDTKEKILDLIQQVKHEIIVEKGWIKE